jgi:hypothetical protein
MKTSVFSVVPDCRVPYGALHIKRPQIEVLFSKENVVPVKCVVACSGQSDGSAFQQESP